MRIASVALLLAGCASGGEIPAGYRSYGRVDDAPRLSASRDPESHGRKRFWLYAKDREAYRMVRDLPQPIGQVVVMEPTNGAVFAMMKTGDPESDAGWIYATMTPDGKTATASGKIASCMECHQSERTNDRLFGVHCR